MFESFPFFFEVATFLFIFAVVYGLLGMANILKSKRADAIIALVFGAVAASQGYAVSFFKELLPLAAIVLGILFIVGFIKKLFLEGNGNNQGEKDYLPLVVILAVLVLILAETGDMLKPILSSTIGLENGLFLIGFFALILIFYASWEKIKDSENKKETQKVINICKLNKIRR